tara:strand:+ start:1132 stop:1359 length:228 start_codon:yes stop_codon:yes gene_type:complete
MQQSYAQVIHSLCELSPDLSTRRSIMTDKPIKIVLQPHEVEVIREALSLYWRANSNEPTEATAASLLQTFYRLTA